MIDSIKEFIEYVSNSEAIIRNGGLALLMFIIFAETGLLVGFFLPGDYLLFLSGLTCASGLFPIQLYILVPCSILAAFAGNTVGYFTGKYIGPRLFKRDDSFLFKKKHLEKTKSFYEKHGGKTMVIARFLPIVRTFAPVLAGAINMNFKSFTILNMVGAIAWVGLLIPAGYFLGIQFPWLKNYVEYIIIGFVAITTLPLLVAFLRSKKIKQ